MAEGMTRFERSSMSSLESVWGMNSLGFLARMFSIAAERGAWRPVKTQVLLGDSMRQAQSVMGSGRLVNVGGGRQWAVMLARILSACFGGLAEDMAAMMA